ncbi:hypothetical protein M5K25_010857 [Dendrobium thyrsiflorum]|uniref:Uncharacterized protein n=1 Tax=Dendrobium thyrsiflorum TaxID=117978 RepID=A0ABD0V8F3_DENTH
MKILNPRIYLIPRIWPKERAKGRSYLRSLRAPVAAPGQNVVTSAPAGKKVEGAKSNSSGGAEGGVGTGAKSDGHEWTEEAPDGRKEGRGGRLGTASTREEQEADGDGGVGAESTESMESTEERGWMATKKRAPSSDRVEHARSAHRLRRDTVAGYRAGQLAEKRVADGGGIDDGPDQDPMVPSSRVIMVPSLLRFDAIGEHPGAGHNHKIVMPFGGESPGSEGPES